MGKIINILNQKYNRLTVISFDGLNKNNKARWNCICDCGKRVTILSGSLRSGYTKSCGCHKLEVLANLHKTHGKSSSKEYKAWIRMKDRCLNPNNPDYKLYSGLGISEKFLYFDGFLEHIGEVPPRLDGRISIDRLDNSKGYFEGNIRWANDKIQNRNKTKRRDNKSGTTGVSKVRNSWVARCSINDKIVSKHFSIKKYGNTRALNLAKEARACMLMNLEDYTDGHGK